MSQNDARIDFKLGHEVRLLLEKIPQYVSGIFILAVTLILVLFITFAFFATISAIQNGRSVSLLTMSLLEANPSVENCKEVFKPLQNMLAEINKSIRDSSKSLEDAGGQRLKDLLKSKNINDQLYQASLPQLIDGESKMLAEQRAQFATERQRGLELIGKIADICRIYNKDNDGK